MMVLPVPPESNTDRRLAAVLYVGLCFPLLTILSNERRQEILQMIKTTLVILWANNLKKGRNSRNPGYNCNDNNSRTVNALLPVLVYPNRPASEGYLDILGELNCIKESFPWGSQLVATVEEQPHRLVKSTSAL